MVGCPHCNKRFRSVGAMSSHITQVHIPQMNDVLEDVNVTPPSVVQIPNNPLGSYLRNIDINGENKRHTTKQTTNVANGDNLNTQDHVIGRVRCDPTTMMPNASLVDLQDEMSQNTLSTTETFGNDDLIENTSMDSDN